GTMISSLAVAMADPVDQIACPRLENFITFCAIRCQIHAFIEMRPERIPGHRHMFLSNQRGPFPGLTTQKSQSSEDRQCHPFYHPVLLFTMSFLHGTHHGKRTEQEDECHKCHREEGMAS